MSQPFLVIGGTGQTITQRLLQRGLNVRVLARHIHSAQQLLDPKVEVFAGDITDAASVVSAMRAVKGCVIIRDYRRVFVFRCSIQ